MAEKFEKGSLVVLVLLVLLAIAMVFQSIQNEKRLLDVIKITDARTEHLLKEVQEISSRIMKVLDTDPEIFIINDKNKNEIKKGGNDPQLWTIATKKYFNSLNQS